ncbi:hypothetical protein AB1N83_012481, partial [Pleurotus pulmonarius]
LRLPPLPIPCTRYTTTTTITITTMNERKAATHPLHGQSPQGRSSIASRRPSQPPSSTRKPSTSLTASRSLIPPPSFSRP